MVTDRDEALIRERTHKMLFEFKRCRIRKFGGSKI